MNIEKVLLDNFLWEHSSVILHVFEIVDSCVYNLFLHDESL